MTPVEMAQEAVAPGVHDVVPCEHCQGCGVIDGWDICPACFGNSPMKSAPPAAGPWIKIELGCVMPAPLDKCLLASEYRDFRVGSWCPDMKGHEPFWHGDGLTFEPTHYAIINPPEEPAP